MSLTASIPFISLSSSSNCQSTDGMRVPNRIAMHPFSNYQVTAALKVPYIIPLSVLSNSRATIAYKAPNRLLVRSSNSESPLRRPSAPIKEATPPLRPVPPSRPSSDSSSNAPSAPPPIPSPPSVSYTGSVFSPSMVTVEYQRQRAKELQEYFREKKFEELSSQGQVFGFTKKNEISNGRWAMFGFAVGLLTEYATGSNFVDQMKIIISNLGIADLE
eukprot:Gb_16038 [translate_table: standard]